MLDLYIQYYNHVNNIIKSLQITGFNDFLSYKPNLSTCFLNSPKQITNYTQMTDFNHSLYMKYTRCILDHDINKSEKESNEGLLLIADSLCPLGIEITHQLRKSGIDHLDIRGVRHLDINSDSGKEVLDQFNISKALIVCDSSLSLFSRSHITVYSAIKSIKADVMIDIPPVFGHNRGKYSGGWVSHKGEDLYYQCLTKNISKYENDESKYVLAKDAAEYIIEIINSNQTKRHNLTQYSFKELHQRFYSHCIENKKDLLIESLLESCKAFPPQDNKEKTLSIVMVLSLDSKYITRANKTLHLFEYYLKNYPQNHLPFEFIIVAIDEPNLHIENLLSIGPYTKSYINFIKINQIVYNHILNRLNISYFPEFILRNVGIRRSKGEFILSISSDTFPNKKIFDYILHRKFNLHSYLRAFPLETKENNKTSYFKQIIQNDMNYHTQYFISETKTNLLNIQLASFSCGSFQLAHWRIWKIIHGFIEVKELFHIDAYLGLDIIAAIPSPTLVKIIGYNYHQSHVKRNYKLIKFSIGNYRIYSRKGFLSAETFNLRENWGLANIKSLPSITF